MTSRWAEHLAQRIAEKDFILFLGAGVSRNSVNESGNSPSTWDQLLKALQDKCGDFAQKEAAKALSIGDYLAAAQIIEFDLVRSGLVQDFRSTIKELTDGPKNDFFQGSDVHAALLDLQPLIVVTTNYDKIFERASLDAFHVHKYDSTSIGSDVRRGEAILLKIHGSVDNIDQIVLTRTDYTRLRRDGAHALDVLKALLFTRTALFVGYGLNDPDIELILENTMGIYQDEPSHYLLCESGAPEHRRHTLAKCYGTQVVEYTSGEFLPSIIELKQQVDALRSTGRS